MTAVTARARMACDEVEPLLSPCVDGELLEDDRLAVRAHVETCPSCQKRVRDLQRVKSALTLAAAEVQIPDELLARVRADVRSESRRRRQPRAALAGAAVAAAAVVAVLVVASPRPTLVPAAPSPVMAAALERHALELPVDVASPDPRRVQEFLARRTGQALVVPRLETLGWGLQGARVVDVERRRGAQIVYTGGYGQRLSVVVLPDPDGALSAGLASPASLVGDNGLRVRTIARDHSLYSFVSDVDAERLEQLSGVLER